MKTPEDSCLSPIRDIIEDIRAGRMVILIDDEDRENEGDVVIAAQHITPEAINFMARHARGLICLTLTEDRCRQLGLNPMARDNRSQFTTAFTVSIEAAEGVTTGISAADRARTVQAAVARNATPADIVQPGHIFPIQARSGGVLVRAGHTEAGCDLAGLAGLEPAAVICEVMNEDGSMSRLPDLIPFAQQHGLKIGAIRDLIHYRAAVETLIERVADKAVQTAHGEFQLAAFTDRTSGELHLAMYLGEIKPEVETLVRVHEPVSVLDFLDPDSSRHSFSIDQSLSRIAKNGHGVLILLRRPESSNEMLSALGVRKDPLPPAAKWDPRLFGIGAQILRDLGVGKMRVMAPARRIPSMTGFGLEVTGHEKPGTA
ncbi:MAG: 3,4-dihydroxy-2-butanone-4-phosphate synthase [Candidatus Dactylopiibacterium carminicum]|uniref:3,4-dihydroxy-2-butanone 4-phosphate synthase n=1 Tax=Candidatus Dactylopiibacterium carminicum TaxID=857335 RepID=A0A272EYV9_9RHOO|nr:bifunctional 3,4-dihydroxy-2-butanone-4-phosphate synthase/GTP cyclohydrolase II [Candidatus Dactylopiibacterium carminicum]KAF7600794.1 3,4-dihydroxy-2-butanone-4-phosphate synthase [Candidatus Dactylopiibacterium carminicum]PAS95293.1 MAG: 3,4-dihydroxy-2-butanone-4-phosphate synthase [Candidatus Dactylopiibacterium carminicum]PAS98695.1 MAG: 3,4-dihydroxy-2-butanone-4-phosphate synthase [Candidatus Dactylopiibacterium carminicum]PAT00801.1 MAG: 3,4-dihydroxy-2-butanone-4-phosphate synthas